MRKVKLIIGFITVLSAGLYAQQQDSRPKSGTQEQQQTEKVNASGNREGDAQQSAADIPGAAEAGADANANNQGEKAGDDERASNTPAVRQTTSSDSGSPAVLSGNNGTDRDGTNSVQRASMNMAGSPVSNLKLDGTRSQDVDAESKDRQAYEQDKQRSARERTRGSGGTTSGGESADLNEKSRRENNKLSDQNLSAKDKSRNQKNAQKPEGKSKRNKSRG